MFAKHEVVLLHVAPCTCARAGRCVADCMRANSSGVCVPSPSGSVGLGVQLAGLLDHLEQVRDRDLAQHVAGPLGVPHVALDQAAVGPADLGDRLAGGEVNDLVDFQRLVRLAPAEDGDFQCSGHGGFSSVGG